LTHVLPSGWEIHDAAYSREGVELGTLDHQEVRDDRIHSYFGLEGGERKRFAVLANAAYRGRYYLPSVGVSAMYDDSIQARVPGRWIEVVAQVDDAR
jgi:uncharacterized protein YfaS (alpha-2-macroglobulin family)